jgi:hypothetical protein
MVLGTTVDADLEKKIPKAKKPTMSGTLFFIYTTVYFFDNVVNEIKK